MTEPAPERGPVAYLLDTNVVSEPLRPAPDPGVLRKIEEHRDRLAIAAPVWHELVFGAERLPDSRRKRAIELYLLEVVAATLPILPYDRPAARHHAIERARLAALGSTPPFVDGQIAAIAHVHRLTLVTADRAGFEGFEGIAVEDWRSG